MNDIKMKFSSNDTEYNSKTEGDINLLTKFNKFFSILSSSQKAVYEISSPERIQTESDALKNNYINELSSLIKCEQFELGFLTESEIYFEKLLNDSKDLAQLVINNIHHIAFIQRDKHTILGVLYILAQMPYEKVSPVGPTIAAASITTDDREIVRYALMAFEYWNDPVALKYFDAIRIHSKWLDKYKIKIENRLREVAK